MSNLLGARKYSDLDDQQALEMDRAAIELLRSDLVYHSFPPTALGSTGGTLAQKFQAVMHALFLESCSSAGSMVKICVSTFDLGTEFSLPKVQPVPLFDVFPWASLQEPTVTFECPEADDLGVAQDMLNSDIFQECEQQHLSLTSSLAVSGVLHIIHNAANDVLTVTKVLDQQIDALTEVCSLLSGQQTCARLLERCFASRIGQQLQGPLKRFSCKVYCARWGSVAFCCEEVLKVRSILQWGWSLERYMGGPDERVSANLQTVDDALRFDFWWASMAVLSKLYTLVRSCLEWSEGCPCHFSLDWPAVPRQARLLWETCPLRGLRVPEICAGDFFASFETLQEECAVELLQSLPPVLSDEDRGKLLRDFEKGRAHLFIPSH